MPKPIKPPALAPGDIVRVIFPASAAADDRVRRGVAELEGLGYRVHADAHPAKADGYFAAPLAQRLAELKEALDDRASHALICGRGGYGSSALLDGLLAASGGKSGHTAGTKRNMETARLAARLRRASKHRAGIEPAPKLVIGFSDVTALQTYLWQRLHWVTLYGPMVAAGLDKGADRPDGYDLSSFSDAVSGQKRGWNIALGGEALVRGAAPGIVLGGCLTLLQTTLGTSWEIDTRGAILLLEDCNIKPYQLDRMLLHMTQAGKFREVRGIVLGDFPGCEAPGKSGVTVRDVCRRILGPLGIPLVFGAAVGHTARPLLTVPLGVRARLHSTGEGKLEILEPAVTPRT